MVFGKGKQPNKSGLNLPSPRLTGTGLRLILMNIALPFLLVLVALDFGLYLIFKHVLGSCYGVWCLL